ncbi:PREDICTED: uncharacterized protein LOC109167711 [Ipomoea nil]|uniref:uncharacterized protein LOC109167711 n=1 Tax=Ipomoea nil TaxID=35883 RepID=UPI00090107A3|nr:PREDICTED: uncharacterized protein LOC109167711 [Ipomoea nil]
MQSSKNKHVEKASSKKSVGNLNVNPRLAYHYGVPPGALLLAYDSIQKILALSTKDGRIKLFGKDGAQALLESPNIVPSKFLQFMENQGFLIKINVDNHIEVWNVDQKSLSNIHEFKRDITSFKIIQHTPYMYIGDSLGYVWVLEFEKELCNVVRMKYRIPFSESHGNSNKVGDIGIVEILPQPTAETKRVLIIFRDGVIILWAVQESKAIFKIEENALQSVYHDAKKATSACWACPNGTKLVVGYSNGDIIIWTIPAALNLKSEQESFKESSFTPPNAHRKLNIGYKSMNIPIAKLRWAYADGKASRVYVTGFSDNEHLSQVVLLNEDNESPTILLGLRPPEYCLDMEIISSFKAPSKQKYDAFLLLGKSGVVYAYDDSSVERYLLKFRTKSPPSPPKEIWAKLPFVDSSITVAKLITDNPYMSHSGNQDCNPLTKDIFPLFPFKRKDEGGTSSNSACSVKCSKAKNLYITGHSNGAINFWDVSCPLLLPIVSLTQQSEDNFVLSGVPVTALCLVHNLDILISGDQSGMIRIYKYISKAFAPDAKSGSNQIIKSLKLVKVKGAVVSITVNPNGKSFCVGSVGYVSLIDFEGLSLRYERSIGNKHCTCPDIISSQFEKNVLVVATRDSSVLALDGETGNILSPSIVHPTKTSRALFMQIIGAQEKSSSGSSISDCKNTDKGNSDASRLPLVLLCSEKAVYVYSLEHVVQGDKKVLYETKFDSSSCCCWASTFDGPQARLILLFSNGKVEIRSLPELSVLKETSVRGLTLSTPKQNSISDTSICSSQSGDLIVADKDQEMFFISVSVRDSYRSLKLASQVFDTEIKDGKGPISAPVIHTKKKKGAFGSFFKGHKAKNLATEDPQEIIEELSTIFSVPNFPWDTEFEDENLGKAKGNSMFAALKQKLGNFFKAMRGNFNCMKVKNDEDQVNEAVQDTKAAAVERIKEKYGRL